MYFRLGAESYSSLGRVGKKEENSVSTFELFRLGTSFESAPVSVKILAFVGFFYFFFVFAIIPAFASKVKFYRILLISFFEMFFKTQ